MGKPFWGIDNFATADSTVLSARSQSGIYPVGNLGLKSLYPPYRSADMAVSLNGNDEYLHAADHADFDITGDLAIEAVFRPDSIVAAPCFIAHKLAAGSGYALSQSGAELALTLNGGISVTTTVSPLEAGVWVRIVVVYEASAAQVSFWKNGSLIALADNGAQSGATVNGTIPGGIVVNATRLTFGADAAGANRFAGACASLAISASDCDHAGWLEPSASRGYWDFQDASLDDVSGRGHTLTGPGIDAGNFFSATAFQWIRLAGESSPADILFIDRRHNLSEGAHVSLWRGSPFAGPTMVASTVAGAGSALVLTFPALTDSQFYLELHDPGSSAGFLEIPHLFLGLSRSLSRSFLRGFSEERAVEGIVRGDGAGGKVVYPRSGVLWRKNLRFRLLPGEKSLFEAVSDRLATGAPVVFCEDEDNPASARLVTRENPLTQTFTHEIGARSSVEMRLEEVGS